MLCQKKIKLIIMQFKIKHLYELYNDGKVIIKMYNGRTCLLIT